MFRQYISNTKILPLIASNRRQLYVYELKVKKILILKENFSPSFMQPFNTITDNRLECSKQFYELDLQTEIFNPIMFQPIPMSFRFGWKSR